MTAALLRTVVFTAALSSFSATGNAQPDIRAVKQCALRYADSLLTAFSASNIEQYIHYSHPGVIGYYGGKRHFREFVQRARQTEQPGEISSIEIVQTEKNGTDWQCLIKRSTNTKIDGKKATILSYIVGRSTDDGLNWKYVDMSHSPAGYISYIMPDLFAELSIPQRQVIFQKEQLAVH